MIPIYHSSTTYTPHQYHSDEIVIHSFSFINRLISVQKKSFKKILLELGLFLLFHSKLRNMKFEIYLDSLEFNFFFEISILLMQKNRQLSIQVVFVGVSSMLDVQ